MLSVALSIPACFAGFVAVTVIIMSFGALTGLGVILRLLRTKFAPFASTGAAAGCAAAGAGAAIGAAGAAGVGAGVGAAGAGAGAGDGAGTGPGAGVGEAGATAGAALATGVAAAFCIAAGAELKLAVVAGLAQAPRTSIEPIKTTSIARFLRISSPSNNGLIEPNFS